MSLRLLPCKATTFLFLSLWLGGMSPVIAKTSSLEDFMQKLGFGVISLERSKQNDLLMHVEVNEKSIVMIVDSGCSITVLDSSVAKKLKTIKEMEVEFKDPLFEGIETDSFVLFSMKIGSARFENQPAKSMSLKAQGLGVGGILGCDFMIRNNAFLDCGAKRLYVRSAPLSPELKEKLEKTLSGSGYKGVSVKRDRYLVPICNATVNDVPVRLIVDSGGVWTILDDSTAKKLELLLSRTGRQLAGVKRQMKSELLTSPVNSIKLDGVALPTKGLLVGVGDLGPWIPGDSVHANGILGAELLAQSWALLDFQARNMWFVPETDK